MSSRSSSARFPAGAARLSAGILLALRVLAAPGSAPAQEPDTAQAPASLPPPADAERVPLGLREALARGVARSEDVAIARARLAEAEARAVVARAEGRPRISSMLRYTRTFESVFDDLAPELQQGRSDGFEPDPTLPLEERVRRIERALAMGAVAPGGPAGGLGGDLFGQGPFGAANTWVAALTYDQVLFSGGRTGSRVDAAEREAEAAGAELRLAVADAALRIKEAYYDAALARSLVAIAGASLELADEQVEIARTRFGEGAVAELEVLRAEVERENLVPELTDAQDALQEARLRLATLVDLPLDAELVLTSGLCPAGGADGRPDDLPPPERADPALLDRPAVAAAERRAAARAAEVDAAEAAFLPTVSAFGNLGWQAFPEELLPVTDDWFEDWFAGLELEFPIFLGGRRGAELDAARAQRTAAERTAEREREDARADYRRWYGELTRAWQQARARARTVERARRIYELTDLRYREGAAIQLEVLDALVALRRARTNLTRSHHDYFVAVARAEEALGRPLDEMTLPAERCPVPG